jgi:hypothetical protein
MWNDKPDGYPIPARNPMGTGTNFYPWVWVRVQIYTRNLFANGQVPYPTRTRPVAIPNVNRMEDDCLLSSLMPTLDDVVVQVS